MQGDSLYEHARVCSQEAIQPLRNIPSWLPYDCLMIQSPLESPLAMSRWSLVNTKEVVIWLYLIHTPTISRALERRADSCISVVIMVQGVVKGVFMAYLETRELQSIYDAGRFKL